MARKIVLIVLFIIMAFGIFTVIRNIHRLPWVIMQAQAWILPGPGRPRITHGEFPFRLVYTVDGKKFIVEDVYIAEFAGFYWDPGRGVHRNWRGHIESTGERGVVVFVDETRRVYFTVGTADYYMGDFVFYDGSSFVPRLILVERVDIGSGLTSTSGLGTQCEIFNIKLIEWELSAPIENSFR